MMDRCRDMTKNKNVEISVDLLSIFLLTALIFSQSEVNTLMLQT